MYKKITTLNLKKGIKLFYLDVMVVFHSVFQL